LTARGIMIIPTMRYKSRKAQQVINDNDAAGTCAAANRYCVGSLDLNPPVTTPTRIILELIEKFTTEKTAADATRPTDVCTQCLTLLPQSKHVNR